MEEKLFAKIGRQHVAYEALDAEYNRLLALLGQVVAGEVDTSRLLVDLTNHAWQLAPPGERPCCPATVNGLPVVVVAPARPDVAPAAQAAAAAELAAARAAAS